VFSGGNSSGNHPTVRHGGQHQQQMENDMKDKHDQSTIDWIDTPTRSQFKQQAKQLNALSYAECERLVEVLEQQLAQSNKQSRIGNKTLAHS
jgi:hypothetical protein